MNVSIREIKDCCGKPTVEITYKNHSASAPSGTSTGKYEVPSFRHSITSEISAFKKMIPSIEKIKVEEFSDFEKVESLLKNFGASIIIALEYAILKSRGGYKFLGGKKIPLPLGNCIGGGAHGGSLDFQEFLVMEKSSGSIKDSFFSNMKAHKLIHEELSILDSSFSGKTTIEGAWAPTISNEQALALLSSVAKTLGLNSGVDIAASTFYKDGIYHYRSQKLRREQQIEYLLSIMEKYSLRYIEDPLEQEDFDGFSQLMKGNRLICGDDLTATNPERLKKAIDFHSINAVIIKPNQIGSLIKTKKAIDMAKKHHIIPVLSHRSRETEDNTLAHLAVGFEAPILKIGILGKERTSKITELARIEKELHHH
jgi:enolase